MQTKQPASRKVSLPTPEGEDLDARSWRARAEEMSVTPLGGGVYEVDSESGNTYLVDLIDGRCTCPDHMYREQRCKHVRRVAIEINEGRTPPPGKLPRPCAVCGTEVFVPENDEGPHLCPDHDLQPGDAVVDRETGDLLVVVNVTDQRADQVRVGEDGPTVADYPTNREYDPRDPVVEVLYPLPASVRRKGIKPHHLRRYSFPLSRLDRKVPAMDEDQATLSEFAESADQN